MKLVGIEIPLKPFLRLFDFFLIRHMELSTSVHRLGNSFVIIAGIDRTGQFWRVEREIIPKATDQELTTLFIEAQEELSYRIFTSLSSVGSNEWAAVKEFSDGLLAYRETLKTDKDRVLKLRKAEDHFFRARSLDKYFARCGYNLGIVYTQLSDVYKQVNVNQSRQFRQAATASFMQTLSDNPEDVDAAYALAISHQEENDFADLTKSIEFAQRAIAQMPMHAQAWNAVGHVSRPRETQTNAIDAWAASRHAFEFAAAFAWRDLCRATSSGRPELIEAAQRSLVVPFANLAEACDNLGRGRRSRRVLRQAIHRFRHQHLYFILGKNLLKRGNVSDAIIQLKYAISLASTLTERARYYAYITAAEGRCWNSGDADSLRAGVTEKIVGSGIDPFEEALASPSSTDPETRVVLRQARPEKLPTVDLIDRILHTLARNGAEEKEWLHRMLGERIEIRSLQEDKFTRWARAVLDIEVAGILLLQPRSLDLKQRDQELVVIDLLPMATKNLRQEFPAEERLRLGYERLAEARQQQGRMDEARVYAEMAVAQNPFSASANRQLGVVHFRSRDYELSEKELRRSLALDPFNIEAFRQLALLLQVRADMATTRADRIAELRKAI